MGGEGEVPVEAAGRRAAVGPPGRAPPGWDRRLAPLLLRPEPPGRHPVHPPGSAPSRPAWPRATAAPTGETRVPAAPAQTALARRTPRPPGAGAWARLVLIAQPEEVAGLHSQARAAWPGGRAPSARTSSAGSPALPAASPCSGAGPGQQRLPARPPWRGDRGVRAPARVWEVRTERPVIRRPPWRPLLGPRPRSCRPAPSAPPWLL